MAADEVHVEHAHQRRLVGVGRGRHRKAAGDVHRGPQVVGALVEARHVGLVAQVAARHEAHAVLVRKVLDLGVVEHRDPAMRAAIEQGRDDCGAERAGPAGDDDVPPVEVHGRPPSRVAWAGA